MRAAFSAATPRSRTRGWRTPTGPIPVITSRSGRCPWRTMRLKPEAVFRSLCLARNSATSASTACASRLRAPLRSTSVNGSANDPGCSNVTTLASDTAYHSFAGEVEASTPPRYAAFIPSARHQLSRLAPRELDVAGTLLGRAAMIVPFQAATGQGVSPLQQADHDAHSIPKQAAVAGLVHQGRG